MTKELQSAVADAQQALEQRALIRTKIQEAKQDLREIEADAENAKARLGAAEADVALGGDVKTATAARKALAQLRDGAETLEARRAGLEARLTQLDDDLPRLVGDLRRTRYAESAAELRKWLPSYRETLEQLRSRVLEGLALQQAFGITIRGLAAAKDLLNVRALDEQDEAIAPVSSGRGAGPSFALAPAAEKMIETYAGVRELERSLEHAQRSIEQSARHEQDRQRAAERRAQAVAS